MEYLGKALIELFKQHRALQTKKLAAIDLFPGQDGLLFQLSLQDGQTMSMLVEKMQIQHATLFNMVERMVKAGLLKKFKDTADMRTSVIYLSEIGRQKLSELRLVWQQIEGQLSAGMSEEEKHHFILMINKLTHNINPRP